MGVTANKATRRAVFGSIVGVLAIIAIVLWYVRSLRPPKMDFGRQKTDLTADEVQGAVDVLVRERSMWARFDSLSGRISVVVENTKKNKSRALAGDISIREIGLGSTDEQGLSWKYEMTISDQQNGWSLTTDGTREHTQLVCQDKQLAITINTLSPAILQLLVMPKILLVSLYKDALFPQGRETLEHLLQGGMPWRNQHAQGEPQSFTFRGADSQSPEVSFTNGHFSGLQKKQNEEDPAFSILLEAPVNSNGFWYPTKLQFEKLDLMYHIDLSDLTVGVK